MDTIRARDNPPAGIRGRTNSMASNISSPCDALILGLRVQHPPVWTLGGLLRAQQGRAAPLSIDRTLAVNNQPRITTRIDHSPWFPSLDRNCTIPLQAPTSNPLQTSSDKLRTLINNNQGRLRKEGWFLNAMMIDLCQ